MKTATTQTTRTNSLNDAAAKTGDKSGKYGETLAYINVERRVEKNDGSGETYGVSPFFGIEVTEKPKKQRLSGLEKELYGAIMSKIKKLAEDPENLGKSHDLNMSVSLFLIDPNKDEIVDNGNFTDI